MKQADVQLKDGVGCRTEVQTLGVPDDFAGWAARQQECIPTISAATYPEHVFFWLLRKWDNEWRAQEPEWAPRGD